jgi:hypothetical protein
MATTTNYGWTTPDDTALVKDGAAAIRTLGSSVDTTTKALNPSTTLGDIEYRSSTANTNTRLGIGTTGQILTVAGGVPSWGAAPASGGMTLISAQTLSGVSGVTYSSLGSYKQLYLVWTGIFQTAASTQFNLRFNNNSSSIYDIWVMGSNAGSDLLFSSNQDTAGSGVFGVDSTATTEVEACKGSLLLDNYTSSTKYKWFEVEWFFRDVASTANRARYLKGQFSSTDAITSLDIVRTAGAGNLSNNANTEIRLYGVS